MPAPTATNFLAQFRLDGRVALVTGAGRGIGLAIAQALAEVGAGVAIQDIDLDVAEAEAKRIRDGGGRATAIGGDATKLADVEAWHAATRDALGEVDILVNNASIQSHDKLENWSTAQVEEILRADLVGPFRLSQLAVPHMKAQRWGRIVNIGSIQGTRGYMGMAPYSAAKGALHNLTNTLARGLGEHGITVNCIAPGYFDTLRNQPNMARNGKKADWLPLRRVGQPADCAGAALLLCSAAGGYITGAVLPVDGGMHVSG